MKMSKYKKKKGVVKWDLEGPISSGYLAHCSHPSFMNVHIEFSASYSMLSQNLVTYIYVIVLGKKTPKKAQFREP